MRFIPLSFLLNPDRAFQRNLSFFFFTKSRGTRIFFTADTKKRFRISPHSVVVYPNYAVWNHGLLFLSSQTTFPFRPLAREEEEKRDHFRPFEKQGHASPARIRRDLFLRSSTWIVWCVNILCHCKSIFVYLNLGNYLLAKCEFL